ncbi:DUF3068 domain-containing protein [Streptomyces sp. NBC_01465]|uniref:DUF3068 domain-containing protein n=1 Tax=Streptomyces sp. NBC_01465 TaxID=2903878 RepID=UPI002E378FF3|nr:DUF3068 domain-containing protein [Streptomyces sp. NBC_01465]
MRRKASLILLAFAVFFTALSPLVRWYAFPRLAKVPANQYQETVLEAKDATLINYDSLKAEKVPKVTIVQTLKGNVEESNRIEKSAGKDVVVWDALSYIVDSKGGMVSKVPERYIFDAHSQAPVHATGEMVDGDPVSRDGIEFKWPFLTEKRDYEYFDAQTRKTSPIHYKGTVKYRGLDVYYFEQDIPWTQVAMPKTMPIDGVTPALIKQTGLTRWYKTKRMFWVDPLTGGPVNGEEIQQNELRNATALFGQPKVTVFSGHVKMRQDYLDSTYNLVKKNRVLIQAFTSYVPWGSLGLGLVLLALALLLEARSRRPGPEQVPEAEPEPVTA